jgi:hypothetical protein
MMDDDECGVVGEMADRKTEEHRKLASVPLCPPKIPGLEPGPLRWKSRD